MEENNDTNARHLGLNWAKQYEHWDRGGLFKPTLIMTNVVIVFENLFKSEIDTVIKLYKLACCKSLKDVDCGCMIVEYIVLLFITIRLHHELKLKITSFNQSKALKKQPTSRRKIGN